MPLEGQEKKDYQRVYMKEYMRKLRKKSLFNKKITFSCIEYDKNFIPDETGYLGSDADGNEMPEI